MEADNIRISRDIFSRRDKCAFYVAITRCKKRIHINDCDTVEMVKKELLRVYSDTRSDDDDY